MSDKYKGKAVYDREMDELRRNFREWREHQKEDKKPFFAVYSEFKDTHLSEISGGALKVYMFIGFHVNSFSGECWVSVETMADFFKNDKRTVKKWLQELEDRGLITRIQKGYKRIANTFLLPYGGEPNE